MTDCSKLNEIIDKSGYKRSFLSEELGICSASFYNKTHGVKDFKYDEAVALSKLLKIGKKQFNDIFFAENVE